MKYGSKEFDSLYELVLDRFLPNVRIPSDWPAEQRLQAITQWKEYWKELCKEGGVLENYKITPQHSLKINRPYVAIYVDKPLPVPPKVVKLVEKFISRGWTKHKFNTFEKESVSIELTGLRFFEPIENNHE